MENNFYNLESSASTNPAYSPETLYNETLGLFQRLNDQNLWHPSDRTPELQVVAMAAKHKEDSTNQPKGRRTRNKKPYRSTKKKGKKETQKGGRVRPTIGAQRNKNTRIGTLTMLPNAILTKVGKWGQDENSTPGTDTQVTVDKEKLKKGMAALLPDGFDTDDLANALAAVLHE